MMKALVTLAALVLAVPLLAGCATLFDAKTPVAYTDLAGYGRDTSGGAGNASSWPDLSRETLTVLGNGAFPACKDAASRFENLTRVKVTCDGGADAVRSLATVASHHGDGAYDVVYGIDNALLQKANQQHLLVAYKPRLADRIDPSLLFFGSDAWTATPVDHGYVGINVDRNFVPRNGTTFVAAEVVDLAKVRKYADLFVTENPLDSSPGLAFLLTTIAKYGVHSDTSAYYDWQAYWRDLLKGTSRTHAANPHCVLVAKDWTEAYEQHFSGGYGAASGLADKPIVVSYTESPAVEVFFGTYPAEKRPSVVLEPESTWHQIQTMAIVNGTKHLQAAQAWIEYTLTDHFQGLRAPVDAVYPVVSSISVAEVFGGLDPAPASFRPARLEYRDIGEHLDQWLKEWRKLYEDTTVNCR